MIGWDFLVFWQIGEAVLKGLNPYAVEFSRYPPVTTLFFAFLALLPYLVAYAVWTGLSLVLYIDTLRRLNLGRGWVWWLAFTPALFNFLTGQIDILFLWLALWLRGGGWKAVAAGALLTLKPQLAAVILPWFLLRWLLKERGLLYKWAGVTAGLHLLPLALDGGIYNKWLVALSGVSEMKVPLSSGIFSLAGLGVPLAVLVVVGITGAVWGWTRDEATSRAASLLSFPLTIWYDDVLLAGTAPAWLMVPYSWAAFIAAYLLSSNLPLATIPLAALGWRLAAQKRGKLAE